MDCVDRAEGGRSLPSQQVGFGYIPLLVQFWFSFYNVVLIGLITAAVWWSRRAALTRFEWRWSIPLVGLMLIAFDFVYFNAVRDPDALVVVLSILRRSSVIVSFLAGYFLFNDVNRCKKGGV